MRLSHPLHPLVVHFPIACWTLATMSDISGWWLGEQAWAMAYFMNVLGTGSAILAMLAGLLELEKLNEQNAIGKLATLHMLLAITAWLLYACSLFLRLSQAGQKEPSLIAVLFSCLGFITLVAVGWLGGQLVYKHGVGVNPQHD